eukprot:scaffold3556_cov190-Cylindrotheca_fusiformis.AAC.6
MSEIRYAIKEKVLSNIGSWIHLLKNQLFFSVPCTGRSRKIKLTALTHLITLISLTEPINAAVEAKNELSKVLFGKRHRGLTTSQQLDRDHYKTTCCEDLFASISL